MSTGWEGESTETETGTDVGDDRDVPEAFEGTIEDEELGVDLDELEDHDI